jgi:hypothetical protein
MKTQKLLKTLSLVFILAITFSCSTDDANAPAEQEETKSFITDQATEYFINRDGTVKITVTGNYEYSSISDEVESFGFVYGQSSNPIVNNSNTLTTTAAGINPSRGNLENLLADVTYYVRGYFELEDGTYFYGNEIQVSTDIDASSTRVLTMIIEDELFFQNSDGITPLIEVTTIEKESPVDIGFEYSLNSDFSDSTIALDDDAITSNIWETNYSHFIEGLTSNTVYYFRPYAKYADGTITNGGVSSTSFLIN